MVRASENGNRSQEVIGQAADSSREPRVSVKEEEKTEQYVGRYEHTQHRGEVSGQAVFDKQKERWQKNGTMRDQGWINEFARDFLVELPVQFGRIMRSATGEEFAGCVRERCGIGEAGEASAPEWRVWGMV